MGTWSLLSSLLPVGGIAGETDNHGKGGAFWADPLPWLRRYFPLESVPHTPVNTFSIRAKIEPVVLETYSEYNLQITQDL